MPSCTEENNTENSIPYPVIQTDDILDRIPHINRQFATIILNLMDYFRNTYGDEDGMYEYILGEIGVDDNIVLPSINQIYDAEYQILLEAGLIG